MTDSVLESRARILISTTEDAKKPLTMHHLSETADRVLSAIPVEDRRAAVHEAQRIANRQERVAPPAGYKPSAKRSGTEPPKPEKVSARKVEPGATTQFGVGVLKEAIEKELRADPSVGNRELRERVIARGVRGHHEPTFNWHAAQVRKKLGIALRRGPRPSNDPQVRVAPTENVKPIQLPSVAESKEIAPISSTDPAEVPHSATQHPTPVGSKPPEPKTDLISIDGDGGSFFATKEPDGRWKVELAAYLPEPLMAQLALVIWERVIGSPQGARA